MRTVFVFISGMTTFTCLGGAAGFFGSGFIAADDGGGVGIAMGFAGPTTGAVCLAITGEAEGDFAARCAFGIEGAEACFPRCTFPDPALVVETAGLAIWTTAAFLVGRAADFLAGAATATFLAADLTILLAAGDFFAALLPPDEWAVFAAAFFAGAIFLTLTAFLAGLAAFFLVAIQLGFFCNKHF
ncbi:MAG TPA: hypothetical protein VN616_17185 [Puia sp.]|nr:hypothetical protein [Puia sp.]